MVILIIGLLLLSVTLNSTGQILYKKGLKGKLKKFSIKGLFNLFLTPKIMMGLILYFGSAVIYLYALSNAELSFAYPFFAVGYALVTFLSWKFLNEKITRNRLIGIMIIITGIIMVGFS